MNAVERQGAGTPVRLVPDDFEVFRTELLHPVGHRADARPEPLDDLHGCFLAAKKVALALHALIRGQFPRDNLYIVGFSLYAREFTAEQLPALGAERVRPSARTCSTGFVLARQLLARHKGGNKQIIMITDGEPTAHLEGAEARLLLPADPAHHPGDAERGRSAARATASRSTPSCSSGATCSPPSSTR